MKTDSIRFRFALIVCVCLIGLCLLIYSQLYYTNKLITLNQQNTLVLEVKKNLLQLRNLEKAFLIQKDAQLGDQFKQQTKDFRAELTKLVEIVNYHNLATRLMPDMLIAFNQYQDTFLNLYDKQVKMGLNENSGEHGRFRNRIHALEEALNSIGEAELQVMQLQLRRHEKDFMQRRRMQYVSLENAQYVELRERIKQHPKIQSDNLLNLLEDYHLGFNYLVKLYREIGLDQQSGLLGNLAEQANALEFQLGNIDEILTPAITRQESTVRKHGIVIVGTTALALLALLIKSFMTFQKAFSDFVLFFYRCKRIRQPLDERKMNFIEFKSLAAAANEMIESQRETEMKLKLTKEELEQLKSQT